MDIDGGSGTIASAPVSNILPVSAVFAARHKDHSLSGLALLMLDGDDEGKSWRISDNEGTNIYIETDAAILADATDSFVIYGHSATVEFDRAVIRYIRVSIPAQLTPENCYNIGTMVPYGATALSLGWRIGYTRPITSGVTNLDTPSGDMYPVISREPRTEWGIEYTYQDTDGDVLSAVTHYLGRAMVVILDDDVDRPLCYLLYLLDDIDQTNIFKEKYTLGLRFVELPQARISEYIEMSGSQGG